MIGDFESIVRPFQRRQVSLPVRVFDDTQKVDEDVTLQIGLVGTTKLFNESASQSVTTYADKEQKEIKRETFKKRIENPDDSSQFVDVEVIRKLTTEEGKGKEYSKKVLVLKNEE